MSDLRNSKLVQPVRAPLNKHGRLVAIMVPTLWAEHGKARGQTVGKLVFFAKRNEQFINGFVHQFFHAPHRAVHNQICQVMRLGLGNANGQLSL
jgi:hypothetical protein